MKDQLENPNFYITVISILLGLILSLLLWVIRTTNDPSYKPMIQQVGPTPNVVSTVVTSKFCDSRLDEIEEEVGRLFKLDAHKVEDGISAEEESGKKEVTLQWLLVPENNTARVRILVWKNAKRNKYDEFNITFDYGNNVLISPEGREALQSMHRFEYGGHTIVWESCDKQSLYYSK